MERTAIILVGGDSKRFGPDKGLTLLATKPLVQYVFEIANNVAEEVVIVVGSTSQQKSYASFFKDREANIVMDIKSDHSPLMGALTGFMNSHGDYSVLLPCDTPFVSKDVLNLLFDVSRNTDATIPRWPNGYIEPLQAVYKVSSALKAAEEGIQKGETRLLFMISRLNYVRYVSTSIIRELDPELISFFNINTLFELRKAKALIRKRAIS